MVTKFDPEKAQAAEFNRKKRELHQLYKRYKVGLVKAEDLTTEQRRLLAKYYGC